MMEHRQKAGQESNYELEETENTLYGNTGDARERSQDKRAEQIPAA